MTAVKVEPTEQERFLREHWASGDLRYLLHEDQQRVYDAVRASSGRYVLEIARRWGKTFLLLLTAFEQCLRQAGSRVVYGAPTFKHLAEFILPVVDYLITLGPPRYAPKWSSTSAHVEFPNGSHIHLFGADDKRKADRGRGPIAHLAIFDEAGFSPVLRYVLRSVFRPQLLSTGGRIILGSTPAEEPDHDFTAIAEKAEVVGNYQRRTVWDNPRLARERIEQFIAEDARDEGLTPEAYQQTDEFRREYLAQRVVDKQLVVLPEWDAMRVKLVRAVERPEFFDAMVWLDFGGVDPHAALFAYWHFELAKLVIEDELLLRDGENTARLADAIKAKERELWGVQQWAGTLRAAADPEYALLRAQLPDWLANAADENAPTQPYSRWCDNDVELARDLHELHGLTFFPTAKDNKELQVNALRIAIQNEVVLVHPRCVNTIRHWRATTWANDKRREFRRVGGEHGDLVDCAVYGYRNHTRRNPFPPGWGEASPWQALRRQREEEKKRLVYVGNTPLARRLHGRR